MNPMTQRFTQQGPGDLWCIPEPQDSPDADAIATALVNGQPFHTRDGRTHDFESLMQHIWGHTDDADAIERCIQTVACGAQAARFATQKLEQIIHRAAGAYVRGWIHQLDPEDADAMVNA